MVAVDRRRRLSPRQLVADDGEDGDRARAAVRRGLLCAPDLANVEVASVLRRRWLAKSMTARRYAAALHDPSRLPVDAYPTLPSLPRTCELRADVTAYDAVYVALAEALGCVLVTADARLAHATGPRCQIQVL